MKQFGIELDMVVETDLTIQEFNRQFIAWVEANGWTCGGNMRAIDENGNTVNSMLDQKVNNLLKFGMDELLECMNREIVEQVHNELFPCSNGDFLRRYLELHYKKHGKEFRVF